MVYLNHAGTSWPKPEAVRAAVREALASDPASWPEAFETHHRSVADALGVDDPTRLLLTPGCTSALAVAVADHPWRSGDRVLCSSFEHHGLHRQLVGLEARGVEVEVLPPGPGGPVDLEALDRALDSGGVRLVATTAACNVTGELLPIPEVVERARAGGALALVDAAQVAGWMPLPEADLVTFAGHKGPQAPWGIGGLIAAPGVELDSPGARCELPPPGAPEPACSTLPGYCDVGSVDRLALAGLAAGLRWLAEPEQARRLERARARTERLARALLELPGTTLHGPPEAARRLPTVAATSGKWAPAELAAALAARGVQASAGLQCAPLAHRTLGTDPGGVLRFSAGPSTTDAEVDRAVKALGALG